MPHFILLFPFHDSNYHSCIPGSALSIDAKSFHNKLFEQLPFSACNDKDLLLALTCTFHLFHRRHEVTYIFS